jgi:hypothetical protein
VFTRKRARGAAAAKNFRIRRHRAFPRRRRAATGRFLPRRLLHGCNRKNFSLQLRLLLARLQGQTGMTKKLLIALGLSTLALAGCVAVPYDGYYGGYYGPAVVAPSVGVTYYGGRGHYHRGHRHRY